MMRFKFLLLLLLLLLPALCGCSPNPSEWETDALSDMLSISNVNKQPIRNAADPPQIVGMRVDLEIVNVGRVPIDVPFTVTWSLRDPQGKPYASASRKLTGDMAPGALRRVSLALQFPATPTLNGFQDVVTFDLVNE